jgi:hypothetical protein
MSSALRQAHRHWKETPPTTHAMNLIHQVHYDLEFDEEKNDGMLDVYEVNMFKPKYQRRSHWRRFPTAYLPFLKCLLFRFKLYLDTYEVINGSREFSKDSVRTLKQYIHYMDGVIMESWEQCHAAAVTDELGADWHCPALDRWLCVEFYVKRHSSEDVELYNGTSGENMNVDPFELGILYVYSYMSSFYMYIWHRLDRIRDIRPRLASRGGVRLHHCVNE